MIQKNILQGYIIEPGEKKHTMEEGNALKKALAKTIEIQENISFNLPKRVSVTFIKKSALISELDEKGITYQTRGEHMIEISSSALTALRCYDEALYYIGSLKDFKSVAVKLGEMGCRGLSYRIEAGKYPPQQRTVGN